MGTADWRASDLTGDDWVHVLSPSAPLPSLESLMDGRGFALVRGLHVDGDPEAVALRVAAGFGTIVPQGDALLVHVRDDGADLDLPTTRSYQHSARLSYHADPTDVVALLCVRRAAVGGLSRVVSSAAIRNEVLRTRPDLARVLHEPLPHDAPGGAYESPVYHEDGTVTYAPDYIRTAASTALQREALELLADLHNDPRFALTMDLRPGDLQLLDNRVVVHGRTAFRDDPASPRHLIRVWLTTSPAGPGDGPHPGG